VDLSELVVGALREHRKRLRATPHPEVHVLGNLQHAAAHAEKLESGWGNNRSDPYDGQAQWFPRLHTLGG